MHDLRSTRIGRRGALAALAAAAASWPAIVRADVTTVKFGSVGGLSDAGLYIADELGYFAAGGIAVDMQQINAAPTLVQAIAASQLDVAGISVTPGLFASVALKINLRIVGDKQSYRHGFSGMLGHQEFFVRQGMLATPALMSQVVDGSFARTAVSRLGLSAT
jgi:hypothetical protein